MGISYFSFFPFLSLLYILLSFDAHLNTDIDIPLAKRAVVSTKKLYSIIGGRVDDSDDWTAKRSSSRVCRD